MPDLLTRPLISTSEPTTALLTTLTLTRHARRLTRDTQALHRTLHHAIGDRGLWALPTPRTLVIQHSSQIPWDDRMPGIIASQLTTHRPINHQGQQIEWALIANPVAAVVPKGAPPRTRGKRRPLPPEKWNAWIQRKLGAALDLHRIDGTALPTGVGTRHTMRIVHRRVLFTGNATVTNPDELTSLLDHGVGPAKAYGCGLLLTQEVPQ